jgi:hypothetical protein
MILTFPAPSQNLEVQCGHLYQTVWD